MSYEEHRRSVTVCTKHGVRLRTKIREERRCMPVLTKKRGFKSDDWSWTCQMVYSCWNKFLNFYLPQGLFNKTYSLNSSTKVKFANYIYKSLLYQNK